jgi:hypothetical protein
MTASQHTLFHCDRCEKEEYQLLTNTPIGSRGVLGPENWMSLWLNDQTKTPLHLCAACASSFAAFLARSGL